MGAMAPAVASAAAMKFMGTSIEAKASRTSVAEMRGPMKPTRLATLSEEREKQACQQVTGMNHRAQGRALGAEMMRSTRVLTP